MKAWDDDEMMMVVPSRTCITEKQEEERDVHIRSIDVIQKAGSEGEHFSEGEGQERKQRKVLWKGRMGLVE